MLISTLLGAQALRSRFGFNFTEKGDDKKINQSSKRKRVVEDCIDEEDHAESTTTDKKKQTRRKYEFRINAKVISATSLSNIQSKRAFRFVFCHA